MALDSARVMSRQEKLQHLRDVFTTAAEACESQDAIPEAIGMLVINLVNETCDLSKQDDSGDLTSDPFGSQPGNSSANDSKLADDKHRVVSSPASSKASSGKLERQPSVDLKSHVDESSTSNHPPKKRAPYQAYVTDAEDDEDDEGSHSAHMVA